MAATINHAVKALIYRDDAKILLQQRDLSPHIPFPGYWTFFGGLVENGESLKTALERELTEELGCVPGEIGGELLSWFWYGPETAENHCFPVRTKVDPGQLVLNEGHAMSWCGLHEFDNLMLVPGIIEVLPQIRKFMQDQFQNPPK